MAGELIVESGFSAAKRQVTRGVSYPFCSLIDAVDAAKKFYAAERKSAAPVPSAIKHFGYAESSSGGRQTISALLQFGLLEDEGRKDDRHVKLTSAALDVLLAEPGSQDSRNALVECVQSPKIYKEIFAKWPELPSDHTISHFLQRDKNFNPKAIASFTKDLRASLAFVGVEQPSELAMVGDSSLQSEQQPAQQFVTMPTSRGIAAVAVSQRQQGGISPATSVGDLDLHRPHVLAIPGANSNMTLGLSVGEREWMRGSLSKSTEYRLLISGEIGAKQIGRLIKLLEAQKAVLDDDDDDVSDLA